METVATEEFFRIGPEAYTTLDPLAPARFPFGLMRSGSATAILFQAMIKQTSNLILLAVAVLSVPASPASAGAARETVGTYNSVGTYRAVRRIEAASQNLDALSVLAQDISRWSGMRPVLTIQDMVVLDLFANPSMSSQCHLAVLGSEGLELVKDARRRVDGLEDRPYDMPGESSASGNGSAKSFKDQILISLSHDRLKVSNVDPEGVREALITQLARIAATSAEARFFDAHDAELTSFVPINVDQQIDPDFTHIYGQYGRDGSEAIIRFPSLPGHPQGGQIFMVTHDPSVPAQIQQRMTPSALQALKVGFQALEEFGNPLTPSDRTQERTQETRVFTGVIRRITSAIKASAP